MEHNYGTYPMNILIQLHRLRGGCQEGVAFAKHNSLVTILPAESVKQNH